jgi:ABC-type spermidine/putrescine transport system permease subunit I
MSDAPSQKRPGLLAWGMIVPIATWLLAFVIAPAAIMLVYSFCTRDEIGEVVYEFSADNYRRAFAGVYAKVLWRSITLAGLTTLPSASPSATPPPTSSAAARRNPAPASSSSS